MEYFRKYFEINESLSDFKMMHRNVSANHVFYVL